MTIKKRTIALIAVIGIAVGWITLGGTAYVMEKTSSTEFCISCHTMTTPYEEYQGSIHFSNAKGIRAECSDCHVPTDPIGFIVTKLKATKDIYHEFVTGKIDTEEKYEAHRLEMAESVWAQLKANDSATCRSCHTFDAMDTYEQSKDAAKMHQYGQENNQTCIDCHKGVAHFPPELEMDSSAFDHLIDLTKSADPKATTVYPVQPTPMGDLGTINPATKLKVTNVEGDKRQIEIDGYQMAGAEQVIYLDKGKRAIIASLTEKGTKAVKQGEESTDDYGNKWRPVTLTADIDTPVLSDLEPLWEYAEQLDTVYCSTCHAKIHANHFTVNAWPSVAKGMGARTDISDLDLEILTKFFQYHAKDAKK
ncbi:NapC/NirT family cytochrome c [Vibrio sp. SS-MA-C1-2]|uniref:NapC/NirT family cytochrome c n=1 Tax=Vibrio sp. SS-MA-C1-2 TaxID=2908646 RepID=UPI001F22B42D|nr:NapC/NirT family cytochrome c [Vibrio sp. SS-MA-C1-2]UJF17771.1 NapC/NirT family cytochrome c [Vibrio sp. SS-MA-C1-2]